MLIINYSCIILIIMKTVFLRKRDNDSARRCPRSSFYDFIKPIPRNSDIDNTVKYIIEISKEHAKPMFEFTNHEERERALSEFHKLWGEGKFRGLLREAGSTMSAQSSAHLTPSAFNSLDESLTVAEERAEKPRDWHDDFATETWVVEKDAERMAGPNAQCVVDAIREATSERSLASLRCLTRGAIDSVRLQRCSRVVDDKDMDVHMESASFWLVSLLLSSVLWFAVVPLRDKLAFGVVFSVLFQELMRFAFIYCLHKIYRGIKMILLDLQDGSSAQTNIATLGSSNACGSDHDKNTTSDNGVEGNHAVVSDNAVNDIFNVTMFAYVGGLAFGVMSGLFATLNMLVDLRGPGTLGYYGQSEDFINLYAAQTLLVVMNHTAFTVIMSKSYQSRSPVKISLVVVLHMLYACLTLINSVPYPGPQVVVVVNTVLCVIACGWAFTEAGGQWRTLSWAVSLTVRGWMRNLRTMCQSKEADH